MSIERLELERELHRVLCRYARGCDERDWEVMTEVFAENATANYGGEFELQGRPALVSMMRAHLDGCGPSQHLLGDLVVDVTGDVVTSRVYIRAAHRGAGDKAHLTYETFAEYQDRWVRTTAGWRIGHRVMKVNYEVGTRTVLGPGPAASQG